MDFGVRSSRLLVKAAADDDPLGVDDHGAHHGIGRSPPAAALGQDERAGHVIRVGEHGRFA
jgi:hypothetical protein